MRRGRSAREMSVIQDAIAAIEGQQPKERSAVWMVGEQLKDMVRGNEAAAALLLTDLTQNKEMTLAAAEKKIAERAKKNKVGNCGRCGWRTRTKRCGRATCKRRTTV